MSKGLIVYFSQGGTTTLVAESIAAGLRSAEYEVDLCNLAERQPPGLDGYGLLGVGAPTYYYRLPFSVMDYLEDLPDLAGLPAFAFVLHGTFRGDAGNALRHGLAQKGAREVGYFHCHGAGQFVPYLNLGYQFSPDHPTTEDLTQAEEFGRWVAARVAGETYVKPGDDPPPAAIYRFERFVTNRWLAERLYSRTFRVDKAKCTACGTCIQGCPTENLAEDEEGRPVWSRNCLLCLYCELNCPEEAISSPISTWPVFTPFVKYNLYAGSRDPSLEHARVTFSQGEIQRL
jgi:flavodoxin/ferredoxin